MLPNPTQEYGEQGEREAQNGLNSQGYLRTTFQGPTMPSTPSTPVKKTSQQPLWKQVSGKTTPKSTKSALAEFLEDPELVTSDPEEFGAAADPQPSGNE